MATTGAGGKAGRLVGDISLQTELSTQPVIGYENHAGRTFLGGGLQPFGRVVSSTGHGNNDTDKVDGVLYRNVLGSYLHGPLLGKNPQVTEALITRALERRAR
jgi:CobQ-like glutamine amidotransferase family enzyme